jgi:hypothetical protein
MLFKVAFLVHILLLQSHEMSLQQISDVTALLSSARWHLQLAICEQG